MRHHSQIAQELQVKKLVLIAKKKVLLKLCHNNILPDLKKDEVADCRVLPVCADGTLIPGETCYKAEEVEVTSTPAFAQMRKSHQKTHHKHHKLRDVETESEED